MGFTDFLLLGAALTAAALALCGGAGWLQPNAESLRGCAHAEVEGKSLPSRPGVCGVQGMTPLRVSARKASLAAWLREGLVRLGGLAQRPPRLDLPSLFLKLPPKC